MRTVQSWSIGALALALAAPAQASFHFMQIEQAIGGVAGDTGQQAVQLRMRTGGQNQMQFSRLRVHDAAGANPVLLIDFATPVTNAAAGSRILVASPGFAAGQGPVPDFVMANAIPVAYLAGGRLTFESDAGLVYYSLCWGSYAGPTSGASDNDNDGQFAPCEPGPLPSGSTAALQFTGAASALGTNNAADYAITTGAAVFTNNAGASAAVVEPPRADRGGDCDDTDPNVFRGATEVAGNRYDDDCDGLADEDANNLPSPDPGDMDGDGQSIATGDCDDTSSAVGIGFAEVQGDFLDNDCDGVADEDAAGNPSPDAFDRDGDAQAIFDRVFASGFEDTGA